MYASISGSVRRLRFCHAISVCITSCSVVMPHLAHCCAASRITGSGYMVWKLLYVAFVVLLMVML